MKTETNERKMAQPDPQALLNPTTWLPGPSRSKAKSKRAKADNVKNTPLVWAVQEHILIHMLHHRQPIYTQAPPGPRPN